MPNAMPASSKKAATTSASNGPAAPAERTRSDTSPSAERPDPCRGFLEPSITCAAGSPKDCQTSESATLEDRLKATAARLRRCHAQALALDPALAPQGDLELEVWQSPSGCVFRASVLHADSSYPPTLVQCLVAAVELGIDPPDGVPLSASRLRLPASK